MRHWAVEFACSPSKTVARKTTDQELTHPMQIKMRLEPPLEALAQRAKAAHLCFAFMLLWAVARSRFWVVHFFWPDPAQ
jgi:hypothetical protein